VVSRHFTQGLLLAFCSARLLGPSQAAADESKDPKRPDGIDLVHARASMGASAMYFASRYDIATQRADGVFGAAKLDEIRSGFGPSGIFGLGLRATEHVIVGAEFEYLRLRAPVSSAHFETLEARVAPWATYWQMSLFLDVHFASVWHAGGGLGYPRFQERFEEKFVDPCCTRSGSYSLTLWFGHLWPLTGDWALDLSLRASAVDLYPPGLVWWAFGEVDFARALARGARAGVSIGVHYR
jgi:hypothetical protein